MNPKRLWELTNTRYLFGPSGTFIDALNQQLDPERKRFRVAAIFGLQQTGATLSAQTNTSGPFSLIEFRGALPRCRLYKRWEVITNDVEVLSRLAAESFDTDRNIIVDQQIPEPDDAPSTSCHERVEFVSYASKQIELSTAAPTSTVLLLNDKFDTNWRVCVDGKPAELLRANFIMRGVYLSPGEHSVEFRFVPRRVASLISSAAVLLSLVLCGFVGAKAVRSHREKLPTLKQPKHVELFST
jgi:hypothetical protein